MVYPLRLIVTQKRHLPESLTKSRPSMVGGLIDGQRRRGHPRVAVSQNNPAAPRKAARGIERQIRTELGQEGFDNLYRLLEALGETTKCA